jgi:glycosyltransferase involved in cell wall biosynthesis
MKVLPGDVCLVVAGEFYEPARLYAPLLDALGPQRVHVHDRFIRTEDVGTYFDAADLVVLSHREASQSGVLPLAWRYGLPVVASRVGGLVEHVQEDVTGYLVRAGDPDELAGAVLRALDEGNAKRLREGVRAAREALSGERLAQAVETAVAETPPRRFSLPRSRNDR